MEGKSEKIKKFILDVFFPKFCLVCGKEGSYLCDDCFSLIDVSERQYCPFCSPAKIVLDGKTCSYHRRTKKLNGLYSATSYDNFIIKKLIHQLKYSYVKEIADPLSKIIIVHLANINKLENFSDFILLAVPLHKRKLKRRGFNQSEEIAKRLSEIIKIPYLKNVLIKIKETPAQANLKKEEREKNLESAFSCQNKELISGKKILLVDDVFTTGSTMEECAKTLKNCQAKEVWGLVVARSENI